jgi:hypothetical protein
MRNRRNVTVPTVDEADKLSRIEKHRVEIGVGHARTVNAICPKVRLLPNADNADCRPTRAFLTEEGWRAWNGRAWLLVPVERVLPTDYAGDGRSHLCEQAGFVFCFSPAAPRG